MAKLPNEVRDAIEREDCFVLATVSGDGEPNVIYMKYVKAVDDETLVMADNYFDKTKANVLANGRAAVAMLDGDKGSYQVKGAVERYEDGPFYEDVQSWVTGDHPKAAAVVMKVESVYNGGKRLV